MRRKPPVAGEDSSVAAVATAAPRGDGGDVEQQPQQQQHQQQKQQQRQQQWGLWRQATTMCCTMRSCIIFGCIAWFVCTACFVYPAVLLRPTYDDLTALPFASWTLLPRLSHSRKVPGGWALISQDRKSRAGLLPSDLLSSWSWGVGRRAIEEREEPSELPAWGRASPGRPGRFVVEEGLGSRLYAWVWGGGRRAGEGSNEGGGGSWGRAGIDGGREKEGLGQVGGWERAAKRGWQEGSKNRGVEARTRQERALEADEVGGSNGAERGGEKGGNGGGIIPQCARGVPRDEMVRFCCPKEGGLFRCGWGPGARWAEGAQEISCGRVNDDYCDCLDGSDEPGTPACSSQGANFTCRTDGHRVPTSRVNDGICDCCDGSDEYLDMGPHCTDTCPGQI